MSQLLANLFSSLDKALIRRFDLVVNFDSYSDSDLYSSAYALLMHYLNEYSVQEDDDKLFKKVITAQKDPLMPGELENVIRTSVAFCASDNSNDYLKMINEKINHVDEKDIEGLSSLGFTCREIETLSGISRSTISRRLGNKSE